MDGGRERIFTPQQIALLEAYDRLANAIWVTDVESTRVLWANAAGLRIWRAAAVEAIRPREQPQYLRSRLRASWDAGRAQQDCTIFPEGDPVLLRVTTTAWTLSARDDSPAVLVEGRELEADAAELHEQRAFVESLLEHLPNMVFVKEAAELRFVRFNRAGEELLGYGRDRMIGKNDYDLFPAEQADFFTGKDREVLEQGAVVDIPEEPIETRHLGKRWLHTKKIPIHDAKGKPAFLLGLSEDVTAARAQKLELERQAFELTRSNRALEAFAYIASHDLQEPLRMVASYVALLEKRYSAQLDDRARKYIAYAVDGAKRMHSMLGDILEFSRVGQGDRPFVEVSLSESVSLALENLGEAAASAKVNVADLPTVRGDPRSLVRVFQNLIANALKFRGDADLEITIDAAVDGSDWRIRVRDNGVGFEPEHAARIFEMFHRLHQRGQYEGSGIGLAIVAKIVELHGGRVWADGAPGKGATLAFTLPQAED